MDKNQIKKILIFDTETTGLPPDKYIQNDYHRFNNESDAEYYNRVELENKRRMNEGTLPIDTDLEIWKEKSQFWPRIVQLSYVFYDVDTQNTKFEDMYIELPVKFTSPEYLSSVHPITKTAIQNSLNSNERITIEEAINKFMLDFNNADIIVGHNVAFDINMLLSECILANKIDFFQQIVLSKTEHKLYCTALESTNLLKIFEQKNPNLYKTPGLNQAYYLMFGYPPKQTALHNALIDVVVCFRVFWRMWHQGVNFNNTNYDIEVCGVGSPDIYINLVETDPLNIIVKTIQDITPPNINPIGIGEPLHLCGKISEKIVKEGMRKYIGGKKRKTKRRKTKRRKTKRRKTKKRKY